MPPFAERTLATTECFDFGDQCTVLQTRNGDYGRSREVAPGTAGERWVICRSRAHRQRCCGSAARTPESGFVVSLPVAESLGVRYCRSLEARAMDFRLSKAQQRLQQKCRELAEDFATRWPGTTAMRATRPKIINAFATRDFWR